MTSVKQHPIDRHMNLGLHRPIISEEDETAFLPLEPKWANNWLLTIPPLSVRKEKKPSIKQSVLHLC